MLIAAGLAFGAGMAISGSCVCAHLYRLGEGSPTAPFALIGTAIGMALGFLTWNTLYTSAVAAAPVVWLPATLGYAGTLVVGFAVLAILAAALLRWKSPRPPEPAESNSVARIRFLSNAGPPGSAAWRSAGSAPSLICASRRSASRRKSARGRARLPMRLGSCRRRLEGLDTLRGCVIAVGDALLTPNGLFVIALVLGSFAAALVAGQFKPAPIRGLRMW